MRGEGDPRPDRALAVAAVLSGALVALPFWVGRFVPLMDLPQHLAMATVLRHAQDPAWGLSAFFDAQWGELTPYWLHYTALCLLSFLMPIETASRVYLTAYALALPWAAIALCATFGRPRRVGLLAAPLALNTNLYFGFVNFCSATVLLLFALAALERHLAEPKGRSAITVALLAVALFFAHVQALMFLLVAAASLAGWPAAVRSGTRLLRLAPLLPAMMLTLGWLLLVFVAGRERPFGRADTARPEFGGFGDGLAAFPGAIAGAFQDGSDRALLAVWALMLVWLWWSGRARARPLAGYRLELLASVAVAAYFLAPFSIKGQWNINQRFACIAAFLAVGAVQSLARPGPALASAVALSAAVGLNAARHHRAFDREVGPFDEALLALPARARVMGLMYDARGHVLEKWPYLHFEQYAVVRRGGVAAHSFARAGPLPVRALRTEELPQPSVWSPEEFDYRVYGEHYDAFLVRGRPTESEDPEREPELTRVFASGAWRVFVGRKP